MLPDGAGALLSKRSRRFQELKARLVDLDDERLLTILAEEPKLLRRPIITDGNRAIVGYDQAALESMFLSK